jgi:hypothetical protein
MAIFHAAFDQFYAAPGKARTVHIDAYCGAFEHGRHRLRIHWNKHGTFTRVWWDRPLDSGLHRRDSPISMLVGATAGGT